MSAVEEVRKSWCAPYEAQQELALRHAEELDRLRAEVERLRQELAERCESIDRLDRMCSARFESIKELTLALSTAEAALATDRRDALEVAAQVADHMLKDVAGGTNVGKAIRALAQKEE